MNKNNLPEGGLELIYEKINKLESTITDKDLIIKKLNNEIQTSSTRIIDLEKKIKGIYHKVKNYKYYHTDEVDLKEIESKNKRTEIYSSLLLYKYMKFPENLKIYEYIIKSSSIHSEKFELDNFIDKISKELKLYIYYIEKSNNYYLLQVPFKLCNKFNFEKSIHNYDIKIIVSKLAENQKTKLNFLNNSYYEYIKNNLFDAEFLYIKNNVKNSNEIYKDGLMICSNKSFDTTNLNTVMKLLHEIFKSYKTVNQFEIFNMYRKLKFQLYVKNDKLYPLVNLVNIKIKTDIYKNILEYNELFSYEELGNLYKFKLHQLQYYSGNQHYINMHNKNDFFTLKSIVYLNFHKFISILSNYIDYDSSMEFYNLNWKILVPNNLKLNMKEIILNNSEDIKTKTMKEKWFRKSKNKTKMIIYSIHKATAFREFCLNKFDIVECNNLEIDCLNTLNNLIRLNVKNHNKFVDLYLYININHSLLKEGSVELMYAMISYYKYYLKYLNKSVFLMYSRFNMFSDSEDHLEMNKNIWDYAIKDLILKNQINKPYSISINETFGEFSEYKHIIIGIVFIKKYTNCLYNLFNMCYTIGDEIYEMKMYRYFLSSKDEEEDFLNEIVFSSIIENIFEEMKYLNYKPFFHIIRKFNNSIYYDLEEKNIIIKVIQKFYTKFKIILTLYSKPNDIVLLNKENEILLDAGYSIDPKLLHNIPKFVKYSILTKPSLQDSSPCLYEVIEEYYSLETEINRNKYARLLYLLNYLSFSHYDASENPMHINHSLKDGNILMIIQKHEQYFKDCDWIEKKQVFKDFIRLCRD